jgi:hypothetical protein
VKGKTMHNAQRPTLDDLPTARQLWRSTAIAAGVAAVILATVVWPSEYGIDPTGIGGILGLTEMGEIKTQLSEEAEADRLLMKGAVEPQSSLAPNVLDVIFGAIIGAAHAEEAPVWRDEITFPLDPGQGIEIKLVMGEGAVAPFAWTVEGGAVNFDMHGDGSGREISYEKGRAVPKATGDLTAAFPGNHGWFWRNRGNAPVTITLRVMGDYTEIKRYD